MVKMKRGGAICAVMMLAACGGADTNPAPEPTPVPETQATASIFSPETDPGTPEIMLEPLESIVGFPEGGDELDDDALAALKDILASEQIAENGPIVLRGHSDAGGSDEANMRASLGRAEAVRDWLVENGIAEERISVIAFGEQNPVEPNANPDGTPNEAGRAANRRVEARVALGGTKAGDAVTQDRTTDEAKAVEEEPEAREPLIPLVD